MDRELAKAVLLGGMLGGLLDLAFAVSFSAWNGVTPGRVMQTIASGLLGRSAYTGGAEVQALGVAIHFALSVAWAAGLAAVALRWPDLTRYPVIVAIAFGLIVFLCMRLVVLPLSAYPLPISFKPLATALDLAAHMLLFAGPIVWALGRYTRSAA